MAIQWERLSLPFPVEVIEFKPQTMTKDGTKALAIAYVDPREYQRRLDDAVGIANWSVEYRPLGEKAIIARLIITDTDTGHQVVREEVGEFDDKGLAQYPTASAQAFKRACVTLGLGRYLYDLPQTWVTIENKRIIDNELARLRAQYKIQTRPKTVVTPTAVETPVTRDAEWERAHAGVKTLIAQATERKLEMNPEVLAKRLEDRSYEELVKIGKYLRQLVG